jgi:hypothetical protein
MLRIEHQLPDGVLMRTTIDIADDVLLATREIAARQKRSTGEVLSELARVGLQTSRKAVARGGGKAVAGIRPLPSRGGVVTNEVIDNLRKSDAY